MVVGDGLAERLAADQAHGVEGRGALLAAGDLVDGDDVGVLELAGQLGLLEEALPGLAAAGMARCYVLTIGESPAAAYYGFLAHGRAFAYLGGFDPAFEEASPGAILIGHAIAQAIAEGASEFHFLRGRESYKYSWGARDRWNKQRIWSRADADG